MIAGCIEKLQQRTCGDCERRNACGSIWSGFSQLLESATGERRVARPGGDTPHPVVKMLGGVRELIELRTKKKPTPLSQAVERHVEPLLARGNIRIDEVARALGLSRQTLYRRLKEEGTTFEALLDRLRHRLALRYVREQGMSVKETAYRLGFSDPSAFSRAFKRWTGKSPRDAGR